MLLELSNELLIIIMFGSAILLITLMRNRGKISKTKQTKANDTVLNENTSLLLQQQRDSYEIVISGLKDQCKKLQGAVNRYKGVYPEEDEYEQQEQSTKITSKNIEENYEISLEKAIPLLDTFKDQIPFLANMDKSKIPALLNNPMVKNYIWDYIKKNKEQMLQLGVIVPKGTTQQVQQEQEPEQKSDKGINQDGTLRLEFNQNNQQFMA